MLAMAALYVVALVDVSFSMTGVTEYPLQTLWLTLGLGYSLQPKEGASLVL